ncbi:MAG: oxidoreductase [Chitinophagaceae bacterium]|nr:oxidoreductase [Chitinophagaceae bacterium]
MTKLFTPLTIRSVQFKNRIFVSPMCQYSSEDGFMNDWHLVHLGSRAIGGAAAVFTEATAVSPEGRITSWDAGIWKDEHVPNLKKITSFISANDAVPGIQLAHAGRKASTLQPWKGGEQVPPDHEHGWQIVAPSPVPHKEGTMIPHEVSLTEIDTIINDFKLAATRALNAGFKIIELHGAHGYLLHQFLSPLSNRRSDEYGGSFENRIRFILNIVKATRSVWPADLPLFFRIPATDYTEGGWNENDSAKLSKILKQYDVDLIDCSSGGLVQGVKIKTYPGYQVAFAEKIRREAGILTGAVGLITETNQAEEILSLEQADVIFLARQLLRQPYFALQAAAELNEDVQWPVQYERAK